MDKIGNLACKPVQFNPYPSITLISIEVQSEVFIDGILLDVRLIISATTSADSVSISCAWTDTLVDNGNTTTRNIRHNSK